MMHLTAEAVLMIYTTALCMIISPICLIAGRSILAAEKRENRRDGNYVGFFMVAGFVFAGGILASMRAVYLLAEIILGE